MVKSVRIFLIEVISMSPRRTHLFFRHHHPILALFPNSSITIKNLNNSGSSTFQLQLLLELTGGFLPNR